jgi:hypothetical protein
LKKAPIEDNKKYIIPPEDHQAVLALNVCHKLQARLPEFRSVAKTEKLRAFTIKNDGKIIMAVIKFDQVGPLLRFITAHANARWPSFKITTIQVNWNGIHGSEKKCSNTQ